MMKTKWFLGKVFVGALLVIGCCIGLTTTSSAAIVYFDATGPLFEDVGSIQFDVLGPAGADASNFSSNLPSEWYDFSVGTTVSLFDSTGSSSLQNGVIGTFDIDVILGNFELAHQSAEVIPQDQYNIILDGNDYRISNVPLPSALILLCSGLMGLIGFRSRERMS